MRRVARKPAFLPAVLLYVMRRPRPHVRRPIHETSHADFEFAGSARLQEDSEHRAVHRRRDSVVADRREPMLAKRTGLQNHLARFCGMQVHQLHGEAVRRNPLNQGGDICGEAGSPVRTGSK